VLAGSSPDESHPPTCDRAWPSSSQHGRAATGKHTEGECQAATRRRSEASAVAGRANAEAPCGDSAILLEGLDGEMPIIKRMKRPRSRSELHPDVVGADADAARPVHRITSGKTIRRYEIEFRPGLRIELSGSRSGGIERHDARHAAIADDALAFPLGREARPDQTVTGGDGNRHAGARQVHKGW